jgi:hypothetical protein
VSLHWRNGTIFDGSEAPLLMSDWICMHCPRYMRDSLILPASARVDPAVLAVLARSEPGKGKYDTSLLAANSSPAKSTILRVLPTQCTPDFLLFLTSMQKKPWLREDTALLPVPVTRRSSSPVSNTSSASSRLPQTIFLSPVTTFRSWNQDVFLNNTCFLFAAVFVVAPESANRSNILSLYTSYIDTTTACSQSSSIGTVIWSTVGFRGMAARLGTRFDEEEPVGKVGYIIAVGSFKSPCLSLATLLVILPNVFTDLMPTILSFLGEVLPRLGDNMVLRPSRDLYDPQEGVGTGKGCAGLCDWVLTVIGVWAREPARLSPPSPYTESRYSAAVNSCPSDTSDIAS